MPQATASSSDSIAGVFNKPPADVLAFFNSKELLPGFAWQDVWKGEHKIAFTVAKMMDLDLLADVRQAVEKAIHDGVTLQQFKRELTPKLMRAGWWGEKEQLDPLTGETRTVQLGSSRRLETIFHTNMRTAYASGHWSQIQATKDSAPYLMYDHLDGEAHPRPEHEAWDGIVLPIDDPWWKTHFTPNGFGCKCSTIQLGPRDLKRLGKKVDKAPDDGTYEYVNKRTGEVSQIPKGIDPGWDYNPGSDRAEHLDAVYQAKRKAFDSNGGKVKDGGD